MVRYSHGVPASIRAWCDAHADRISEVIVGGRRDAWQYFAYTCTGWNQGDDRVHSVIGNTAREFIAGLRRVDRCDCDDCNPPKS